ncbi:MAG: DUF1566 domain-containing protein, partial [Elusimicrobiota bacterium]|nr:DUF1566 domain-containing protein [Elusimicrobiota bacterium]
SATFINCTFYGNIAKIGTGGAFQGEGRIFNSIFYKNTADNHDNDIMVKGNLKIDFSLFNYLSGGADVGADIVMGNPKFIDPDNGDMHLNSDSPCIEKGKQLSGLKDAKNINIKTGVTGKGINMGADEAVLTSALKEFAKEISSVTIDNKTGLMWVKVWNSAGCNNGETLEWEEAMAFCAGLTYAGYSDWRLPSKEDFTDIPNNLSLFGPYWTATTEERNFAWYRGRHGMSKRPKNYSFSVRCVRATVVAEPMKSETQKSEDMSLAKEDTVAPQAVETTEEKEVLP